MDSKDLSINAIICETAIDCNSNENWFQIRNQKFTRNSKTVVEQILNHDTSKFTSKSNSKPTFNPSAKLWCFFGAAERIFRTVFATRKSYDSTHRLLWLIHQQLTTANRRKHWWRGDNHPQWHFRARTVLRLCQIVSSAVRVHRHRSRSWPPREC